MQNLIFKKYIKTFWYKYIKAQRTISICLTWKLKFRKIFVYFVIFVYLDNKVLIFPFYEKMIFLISWEKYGKLFLFCTVYSTWPGHKAIYLFVCICSCMHLYLYAFVFVCICICMRLYLYAFVFVCICICMSLYLYVFVFVCVCICMRLYLYAFVFVCVCIYMRLYQSVHLKYAK